MNYLFNPKVRLALIVILLAGVILSSLWDPGNMVQNLIAELAGVALAVWLTVWFVESLLERRHRDRWQVVRGQLFRAIGSHIVDIALEYAIHIGVRAIFLLTGIIDRRSEATEEAADAMNDALEAMREERSVVATMQELFRETEWHFNRLRDTLTPRLIELGADPKLIRLLTNIDDRRSTWKKEDVYLQTESDQEERLRALDGAFDAAMDTLEALIELYRCLATSP